MPAKRRVARKTTKRTGPKRKAQGSAAADHPWTKTWKAVQRENPHLKFSEVLKKAKIAYRKR